MQAIEPADYLLEGMQMFNQCGVMLIAGQHESVIKLVLHIFNVTRLLGIRYQR